MLLGALLDAGLDCERLETALRTIPVGGWSIERRRVIKAGIAATYFDFIVPGEDHHPRELPPEGTHGRHLDEVLALVGRSGLSSEVRAQACAIYVHLAEAEAKVHGTTADRVHFHEVGAVDAILDVAGCCAALEMMGIERVSCSAFPVGRGSISMHHGRYPNPPPATAELLLGVPTYDAGVTGEMVTTTGAAILTALVERPGERPALRAERIGYGAGRSDFEIPNVLRVTTGTPVDEPLQFAQDEIVVLEANIDDMSPQHFELAIERVLAAGAYDVWLAPVTMKKLRPAILFGAIAPLGGEREVAAAILAQTTTLGVRVRRERRYTLPRETSEIVTPFGTIRVKTATVDGAHRRTLEYDDVVRIARERQRPIAEIAAALEEYLPPV